jgi:tetratricopeptide (TPR) repeat protein
MKALELERQATTLRNQGKGDEAANLYLQAKELYQEANDQAHAAGCQHMIGVSYKIENDMGKAMPAYELAIQDYHNAGDILGPGRVYRDMGIMYEYNDRLNEAQKYLLQSKTELEAAPEEATTPNNESRNAELGITLAKLGLVALRQTQFDQAEAYLMEGLQLIRKAGHPFYEMTALMHLGNLYLATEHYGRSLVNLEAALGLLYEYGMQNEHERRLAQIWGLIARSYFHHDNPKTARHFAQKSFAIIEGLSESAQKPLKKDIDADTLKQQLGL